jgi:DNA-binding CsgD family transcriptional regulator
VTVLDLRTGAALLERDDALAVLGDALSDARLGRGSAVLVAGEAGAGKTALARAFCRAVSTRCRVVVGACDPLSTPRPLGPLRDVAGSTGALADLLALDAPLGDVFDALWTELCDLPTVLVLEDLQWADEATLDVLRMLVRRIDSSQSLLIATYRDGELPRGHPMRILLGDLATSPALTRLTMEPLSRGAVATLAAGHDVDPDLLHQVTGGNPFFVTQVLATGGSDVPPSVRDLVLARASALPADAADLLDVVALFPPLAPTWLLESVLGDVTPSLEHCLATGLVAADEIGVGFRHELSRVAIDSTVGPTRRTALHRRILVALEARSPMGDVGAARLAHHAEAAQDTDAVLRHAPAAGREAAGAGAYREAAAQYARALRFAAGRPDSERAALLEGRSRACYLADDQVEAIAVIREAIECRRREGEDRHEARALVELVGYLDCRGFVTEARGALERADALSDGTPDSIQLAYVLEMQARHAATDGDVDRCVELAGRAAELGGRFGDQFLEGHARVTRCRALMRRDLHTGRAELESVVRWATAHGVHEVAARGLNGLGSKCAEAARLDLADVYLDEAIEYCAEHTQDLWRINALALAARVSLDRGDWGAAIADVVALLEDPRESPWPHHEALLVLSLVRARRGDPGARDALEAAVAVGVPRDEVFAHLDLAVTGAELAWTERRMDEVDRVVSEALADGLATDPAALARLTFWPRLARLGTDGAIGEWAAAAEGFDQRGMPYEAALARLQLDDETSLRRARAELRRLGAVPAQRLALQRLRSIGVRGLDRGPRPATRSHPAGLTAREVEVVELLAGGLRNAEVAERLVISRRTVDHHVAAIMRKLGTRTRGETVACAVELGLTAR